MKEFKQCDGRLGTNVKCSTVKEEKLDLYVRAAYGEARKGRNA
jgi:hypothetical protein